MLGVFTDCVGYENLIDFILRHRTLGVEGDMLEVGAFLGGGTRKLSLFLSALNSNKKVYTIDCFDFHADKTTDKVGWVVSDVYNDILNLYCPGQTQEQVFQDNTKGCDNVVLIQGDSAQVSFNEALCFGFIDGAHDEKHVESDFYLVWNNLSHGGVVSLHDYMANYPLLTDKVNELIQRHKEEIIDARHNHAAHILFITKK